MRSISRLVKAQYLLLIAMLLCGCVAVAETPGIWLDIPFVKQEPEGCGAASIAMVMQYWSAMNGEVSGDRADATYILRSLHSRPGHGIYTSAMSQYLQAQGFRTFSFAGDWNMLQQHLQKGRPLIVALEPSAIDRSLHYVVVAGMDSQKEIIMVNDPADRKLRKLDRATFEKQWEGTRRWTLLALPQPLGR
jgi:ABC-type bacteriocin/lantibiotic exporter with double-glycine peptidase domain